MIEFFLFFLGILFVLFDVSFLPALSSYTLYFDLTLFYFFYLFDILKEFSVKFFAIVLVFKLLFISRENLFPFLALYMSAFLVYILIQSIINRSNAFMFGITAFLFFFIEGYFIKEMKLSVFLFSSLFQFLFWILIMTPIFNKVKKMHTNFIKEKGVST